MRTARRIVLPLLLLAALVGAWQVAAANGAIAEALSLEAFLVPSPAEVGSALWENRGLLWENTWVTLREILVGLGFGILAGILLAVPMRFSSLLRDAVFPLAVAAQAIPIVAIGPILLVWFGFGIWPKVILVALACFFPILVTTLDGLRTVEPEAVKMMRTLDASRWAIFRRVEVPTALPSFFSGLKVAAAIAPIVALFAELVGSSSGLMHEIITDNASLEIARVFAAVVILMVIGLLLFALASLAERLVVRWR
ncbi:MAG TPA: ABC transporter permease [Solirubrobacterales bacterium]|jgi:ABC-type nitrate/sulfonate/bicarbonate transport system permease component